MATHNRRRNSATRWFTIRDVAAELGVSERSVRRWIAVGALESWRRGRIVRVSREALDRFLGQG